jgi:hypothetical protein
MVFVAELTLTGFDDDCWMHGSGWLTAQLELLGWGLGVVVAGWNGCMWLCGASLAQWLAGLYGLVFRRCQRHTQQFSTCVQLE